MKLMNVGRDSKIQFNCISCDEAFGLLFIGDAERVFHLLFHTRFFSLHEKLRMRSYGNRNVLYISN